MRTNRPERNFNAEELPIPELPVRHHHGDRDIRLLADLDLRARDAPRSITLERGDPHKDFPFVSQELQGL
jgi:hypothetical protein